MSRETWQSLRSYGNFQGDRTTSPETGHLPGNRLDFWGATPSSRETGHPLESRHDFQGDAAVSLEAGQFPGSQDDLPGDGAISRENVPTSRELRRLPERQGGARYQAMPMATGRPPR